jgi:hypothetical protein
VGALLSAGYRSEGTESTLNEVKTDNQSPNITLIKTTAQAKLVVDNARNVVRIAIPVKASFVTPPVEQELNGADINVDLF